MKKKPIGNKLRKETSIYSEINKLSNSLAEKVDNSIRNHLNGYTCSCEIFEGFEVLLKSKPNRWHRFWFKLLLNWRFKDL